MNTRLAFRAFGLLLFGLVLSIAVAGCARRYGYGYGRGGYYGGGGYGVGYGGGYRGGYRGGRGGGMGFRGYGFRHR